MENKTRLPFWLRRSLAADSSGATNSILRHYRLNTVCESAICPNKNECYSAGTATFMILGNICTRNCSFCAIPAGKPAAPESDEPMRVATAAREMGLKYVVVTSVDRDDLDDEGAEHFALTIEALKQEIPDIEIEVLTPDFHAREELIRIVVEAGPIVFNHNTETVERLQRTIRPQANYARSLEVLRLVKKIDPSMTTKSGLMLGLGETDQEILQTGRDLLGAGCDILTVGQYLPPSSKHIAVQEYVSPQKFAELANELKSYGFREVYAGPHVRSSYHAGETFSHSKI